MELPSPVPCPARVRVLVADDHALFGSGLRAVLEPEGDLEVIAEAASAAEAIALAESHQPDIVLFGLSIRGADGLAALGAIRAAAPPARIIVLADDVGRRQTIEGVRAGARGIVSKEIATGLLHRSLRRVMSGEVWLSREDVTELVNELARLQGIAHPRPVAY